MQAGRSFLVAFALLAALLMAPGRAKAQAVAFYPGVGAIPDGVSLNVTPVVTADRRYVRLALNPNFSTINGFSSFPVPAAVGGGGNGGLHGGAGGLGGGLGGLGGGAGNGGAGNAGGGFRNVFGGAGLADSGVPFSVEYLEASRKASAQVQAKPEKAKPTKGKKPLADPVMVPMKKGEAKAKANVNPAPRG